MYHSIPNGTRDFRGVEMQFTVLSAPSVAEIEHRIEHKQPIPLMIEAGLGAAPGPRTREVELVNPVITEKQHNREISLTGTIGSVENVKVHIQHQFNPMGRVTM